MKKRTVEKLSEFINSISGYLLALSIICTLLLSASSVGYCQEKKSEEPSKRFGVGLLLTKEQAMREGAGGRFIFNLKPGESEKGKFYVISRANVPIKIRIYPADGRSTPTGGLEGSKFGDDLKGMGKWINVKSEIIELKPKERKDVEFELKIPSDSKPGDSLGFIFASLEADSNPDVNTPEVAKPDEKSKMAGIVIKADLRLGVMLKQRTPGELKGNVDFGKIEKNRDGNKIILSQKITNTGNIYIYSRIKSVITDKKGEIIFENMKRDLDSIYPDCFYLTKIPVSFERPLPKGEYTLTTQLVSMDNKVITSNESKIILP